MPASVAPTVNPFMAAPMMAAPLPPGTVPATPNPFVVMAPGTMVVPPQPVNQIVQAPATAGAVEMDAMHAQNLAQQQANAYNANILQAMSMQQAQEAWVQRQEQAAQLAAQQAQAQAQAAQDAAAQPPPATGFKPLPALMSSLQDTLTLLGGLLGGAAEGLVTGAAIPGTDAYRRVQEASAKARASGSGLLDRFGAEFAAGAPTMADFMAESFKAADERLREEGVDQSWTTAAGIGNHLVTFIPDLFMGGPAKTAGMRFLLPALRATARESLEASGKIAAKDITESAIRKEAERLAAESFTRRNVLHAMAASPAALHMTAEQGRAIIASGGTPADVVAMSVPVMAINTMMAMLPISARGKLLRRVASGAALGGAGTVAATAASNPFLPENVRVNPLEAGVPGMALGALFGGFLGQRPVVRAAVDDAAAAAGAKPEANTGASPENPLTGGTAPDAGEAPLPPPPPRVPHGPAESADDYATGFAALPQPARFEANTALNTMLPRINTMLRGTKGKNSRPAVRVLDNEGVATDEVAQFSREEAQNSPAAVIEALSRVEGSNAINAERDQLIEWLRNHNDVIVANDQLSRASAAMTPSVRNALSMLDDGQRADVAMELGVSPDALDAAWRLARQSDALPEAGGEPLAGPVGSLSNATMARLQAQLRRMAPEYDDIPPADTGIAEGVVPVVDGNNNLGPMTGAIEAVASPTANPLLHAIQSAGLPPDMQAAPVTMADLRARVDGALPPADPTMSANVNPLARAQSADVSGVENALALPASGTAAPVAPVRDLATVPQGPLASTMSQRLAALGVDPQSVTGRRAAAAVAQTAALERAIHNAVSVRAVFQRELDAQLQRLDRGGDISAADDSVFRLARERMQAADAEVAARNERVSRLVTDIQQDLAQAADRPLPPPEDLTVVVPEQPARPSTLRERRAAQAERLNVPLLDAEGQPFMLPPPSVRPLGEIQSAMDKVLRERTGALDTIFERIDSGVSQAEQKNLLRRAAQVVGHSETELARLQRELNAATARADEMQVLNALNDENLTAAYRANAARIKSLAESIDALEVRRKAGETISPQEQVLQNAWVDEHNALTSVNRRIMEIRELPTASRGDAGQDPFGARAQATERLSTTAADRYVNDGLRGRLEGPQPPETLGALLRQITRWQTGAPWAREIEKAVLRWMPQTKVRVSTREEIVRATRQEDAFAAYDPYTDTVHLLDTSLDGNNVIHAAYHEAVHAITLRAIRTVLRRPERATAAMRSAVDRLQKLHEQAKQALGKDFDDGTDQHQWFGDLAEFASEVMSNPRLRAGLEALDNRSFLRKFVDKVLDLLGIKWRPGQRPILDEVMLAVDVLTPMNREMHDRYYQIDRINHGLGPAAPMRTPRAPKQRAGETPEAYVNRVREEATANPHLPRDPDTAAEAVTRATVKAETQVKASILFGRHVIDSNGVAMEVAAVAVPTTEGYKLIYSDGHVQKGGRDVFATAEEVRNAVLARGMELDRQGDYGGAIKAAKDTTFAFHDQRAHASPNVRAVADAMRNIVGRYDSGVADYVATRMLAAGSALRQTALTRFDWADSFDATRRAQGIESNLGRALRNADRARQVSGAVAGDPVYDAQVDMLAAAKEAGVTYAELSRYATAKYVPNRNAAAANRPHAGSTVLRPKDVTGFKHGGLTGTPAAEAYVSAIPVARRETMDAILQRYYDAKADVLQLEYESGRLSRDEYVALGGKLSGADGAVVRPVEENFYVPLKSEHQTSARIHKVGTGRKTEAHDPLGMAFADLRQRRAQAQGNFAMRDLMDAMLTHPDPDFGLVQAHTHSGKTYADGVLKWGIADLRGENSLFAWKDGQAYRLTMYDPQVLKYIKTNDPAARNAFLRTLTAGIHFLQHFRTTFVPAFLATASAWDVTLVHSNMEASYNGLFTTAQATSVATRALAIAKDSLGILGKRAIKRTTDDIYLRAYGRDGGGVGTGGRAGYTEAINRMRVAGLDDASTELAHENPLLRTFRNVQARFAQTSDVLHAPEEAVRFGTFKAGIEQLSGKTFSTLAELDAWAREHPNEYAQALEASRKIVSDFSDHGTQQLGSALWMFFNPALQGARLAVDMYKTGQGQRAMVVAMGIGIAGALAAVSSPDDTDVDGGSKHLRHTGRGRQAHLTDNLGFPIDPGIRFAYMLGDNLVMTFAGKQPLMQAGSELARSIFDTFFPVMPYGEDTPAEGLAMQYLIPSAIQPLATLGFGVDSFGRHTDTEYNATYGPDGRRIVAPANFERGPGSVAPLYKDIAASLYGASHGAVDLYPGRLQAFARTALGGVYSGVATALEPTRDSRLAVTRAFEHEYDEYAIKREFDAVFTQRMSSARQLGAEGLRADPVALRTALVAKRAREAARGLTVGGFSIRTVYQMRDRARAENNTEALRAIDLQLQMLRVQQNRIYGAALRHIEEIENGRAAGAD